MHPSWKAVLADEFSEPYFHDLAAFVKAQRREHVIFPPPGQVFRAFEVTPYTEAKVCILGQDPYHNAEQANGLSFSVQRGVKPPPSLVNIFKELEADLGHEMPVHGDLTHWAQQGVFLLNAVLTVQAHQAASHRDRGWETFTDAVIGHLSDRECRPTARSSAASPSPRSTPASSSLAWSPSTGSSLTSPLVSPPE